MQFLVFQEQSGIMDALRGLGAYICQFVYTLMAWVWSLLLDVSRIRLLNSGGCSLDGHMTRLSCVDAGGIWSDSAITLIYKRFTLLLGIIMTFYMIFQFIKYLMTPEEIEDKEKGIEKLGFKLLTVVVLLATTPMLFDTAYDLQEVVLESQLLPKLILGGGTNELGNYGKEFSSSLLLNFYYTEGYDERGYFDKSENVVNSGHKCFGNMDCNQLVLTAKASFMQTGQLTMLHYGLNKCEKGLYSDNDKACMYLLHFDGLFAVAVGLFVTYMLIMYTIDVGARVIQLTFLQVIAPIPIITYLSPKKDGTFQKWLKQCGVTYLDLFMRLGIIFFVTLLIKAIDSEFKDGILLQGITDATSLDLYVYLVLIIGLMAFCKRAPKMVEELFPSMGVASGTFGLKPGDRPLVSNAIGLLGGAATGLRTMAMRAVGQIKRNKNNEDLREEARADYDAKRKASKDKDKEIKQLREQKKKGLFKGTDAEYNAKMARLRDEQRLARNSLNDSRIAVSNTRYRSATLAGLGGLASGAVRGAAKGATLNEIKSFKDFSGKMKEVEAAETQRNAAIDTWYNSGGVGGVAGTIQRTVAGVETKYGLENSKARLEQKVRTIDTKIKANDAYASIEADTKTKRDEAENRLKDKIKANDLKTTIGTSLFTNGSGHRTIKGLEKMNIDLSDVLTKQEIAESGGNVDKALQKLKFTELVGRYSSATVDANAELEKLGKEKIDYDTEENKARYTDEQRAELKRKQDDAIAEARVKLQKAQEIESAVAKHAARNAFTQALQNPDTFADGVTLTRIENAQKAIEVARSNTDIVSRFLSQTDKDLAIKIESINTNPDYSADDKANEIAKARADAQGEKELFLGGHGLNKSNYDELDNVVVRLQNIADARKRENQSRSEEKRKIEASYAYDAAKANDAFNSSTSGKK